MQRDTPCVAYIFLSACVVTECSVTHHDISQLSYYYYLYSDLRAEILPAQSERSSSSLGWKGREIDTHVLVLSDTSDTASRVASNGLMLEMNDRRRKREENKERTDNVAAEKYK